MEILDDSAKTVVAGGMEARIRIVIIEEMILFTARILFGFSGFSNGENVVFLATTSMGIFSLLCKKYPQQILRAFFLEQSPAFRLFLWSSNLLHFGPKISPLLFLIKI